jgi:DNA-binding transcriptional ArsR family regulator
MGRDGEVDWVGAVNRAKRTNGAEDDKPYEEDELIRALNHVLRRQILRLMHSSKEPLSPTQIEQTLKLGSKPKESLSTVSYHVGVLVDYRTVRLVDEQQRRGAMEHFYRSTVSESTWVRGLLKRTQKSDEAKLWPRGRS